MKSPHIVVLSGAGISAESGLDTFRGAGGLWEGYNVYDVATPEAWDENPELVLRFYNMRRRDVRAARPNAAHAALVDLERHFEVTIITQNIDDLHERAGSSKVIHLHGEILKARSTIRTDLLVDLGDRDIEMGDLCPRGGQLRPHVVWFGELVPEVYRAAKVAETADILIVVGTSLAVYPAAGLVPAASKASAVYVVNPEIPESVNRPGYHLIRKTACSGLPELVRELIDGSPSA